MAAEICLIIRRNHNLQCCVWRQKEGRKEEVGEREGEWRMDTGPDKQEIRFTPSDKTQYSIQIASYVHILALMYFKQLVDFLALHANFRYLLRITHITHLSQPFLSAHVLSCPSCFSC